VQIVMTLSLGLTFTALQVYEYQTATLTISDGIYGSVFYISTGFHGGHVLLGTLCLFVCTIRLMLNQLNINHHIAFELAI